MTLEDNSHSIITLGQKLVLRQLGESQKPRAYLMPVPPSRGVGTTKFTLLTDQKLDGVRDSKLEVLFCSVFPLQAGQTAAIFSMNMDLSGDSSGSTRLACKNAADDVIQMPASYRNSKHSFDSAQPFSSLQYDFEDLAEHQFVAVVDKASRVSQGWVIAEFVEKKDASIQSNVGLRGLLLDGVRTTLPAERPIVTELHIPVMHSSLLTYKLNVGIQSCGEDGQLFTPLVRQYLMDPHESKYFVNVHTADISLHGTAPFIPPALHPNNKKGLSLQFWTDPTCNSTIDVSVEFDFVGSLGKLVMRYRTVFAAFPMLVVALVLRIQFTEYNNGGMFFCNLPACELVLLMGYCRPFHKLHQRHRITDK